MGNIEDHEYGFSRRALRGHSHFISDVVISSDGAFALSASWDGELRLWDIATGKTTRRFVGHEKDVLSVAFRLTTVKLFRALVMELFAYGTLLENANTPSAETTLKARDIPNGFLAFVSLPLNQSRSS